MKKIASFLVGFALMAVAVADDLTPIATTVPYLKCCTACSSATTLNNCYYECQAGCGSRGSATGDKCREACDQNY